MSRYLLWLAGAALLAGCNEKSAEVPNVDLHGRLEVDAAMTAQRQAQGIQGEYHKRVLTVAGKDMDFNDFVKTWCGDPQTRNETCQKALRIKKIDDVSGATQYLPNGL